MTTEERDGRENKGRTIGDSVSLSFLIVGTHAIEALSDAAAFNAFLKENSITKRGLLPGMKMLFENLIDDQMLQIQIGADFAFESDRITQRALHKGVPIEQVMSNVSLAKLLRGLKETRRKVMRENSVPDFHITISDELSPWLEAVKHLFENHTEIERRECQDLDKESVLNLFAYSWYLRFLDIRQHLRGYLVERIREDLDELTEDFETPQLEGAQKEKMKELDPQLEKKRKKEIEKERKKYDKCVSGWRTCTAYLWSQLKGPLLPDTPVDSILQCDSWEDLDDLFRPIADGHVAEVDRRLGTGTGDVFCRVSEFRPRNLDSLMIEYDKTLKDNLKLCLDHSFLWYDFEILDGAHPKIFPGVATFTNLLVGSVHMKEQYNRINPIEIRRILHPAGYHFYKEDEAEMKREKHDVGYAILVPSYSTMADYSGWLVSLDCCNDYSGFAGGMRKSAERFIDLHEKNLAIEDILISRNDFRRYLKSNILDRHEKPFSRLSESEWDSIRLEESIELGTELSAVIIELFMATTMAEAGFVIHWQYKNTDVVGDKEIDILAVKGKEVQIIECSRHFPINTERIIRKIGRMRRKRKYIENSDFRRKRITLRYITTKNLDDERFKQAAEAFRKAGISTENIYQIIEDSQHRTEPLQNLLSKIDFLRMRTEGF